MCQPRWRGVLEAMATRVGCVYNYHRTLDLSGWFCIVLKAMGGVVKAMGRCVESVGNAF